MDKKRLVIVGNGFDLHHGLKTRYSNYKEYLKKEHSKLLEELDWICNQLNLNLGTFEEAFWSDVEGNLSYIYACAICRFYIFYSSWHNLKLKDSFISFSKDFTSGVFVKWLYQVYEEGKNDIKISETFSKMMDDSIFINFNYTKTLEEKYSVDMNNIFYIHGDIESIRRRLSELGGNNETFDNNITSNRIEFGASDINIESIINSLKNSNSDDIISLSSSLTKHLKDKISRIEDFIRNQEVEEVVILGHSLSGDDLYYFDKIFL